MLHMQSRPWGATRAGLQAMIAGTGPIIVCLLCVDGCGWVDKCAWRISNST